MKRVWVVGDSGSGKTTVAGEIARRIGATHTELDALFHEPGWKQADDDVFRARVEAVVERDTWVLCGNYYSRLGRLLTDAADTVVWLDYPMRITWPRVVRRSVARALSGKELWNTNRERVTAWARPSHPIWWTLTHHRSYRRRYGQIADHRWLRSRHPGETARWLARLPDWKVGPGA